MKKVVYIVILLLLMTGVTIAEEDTTKSTSAIPSGFTDTTAANIAYKSAFAERYIDSAPSQNPTIALFKSMLVPGWGQAGNKKYIKAIIIAGLESAAFATYWHYRKKTEDSRKAFDNAEQDEDKRFYKDQFDDNRDQRNRFAWYTGTLIFISMFDAYVDAHLVNFPKRDESITIGLEPAETTPAALVLSYRF